MKVVVTGGAGFIGSHLVDRLVRDEWGEIVVLDNLVRGRREYVAEHIANNAITFVEADIRDMARLTEYVRGAEIIFHLAAQSNVMGAVADMAYSFNTNVVGTFNVLQVAHACSVRRVVFTSSREVYGDARTLPVDESQPLNSKNAYGASKAAGELYCRVFGAGTDLEPVVLRLANVYGPRDRDRVIPLWIDGAVAQRDLIVYGGQQLIDFVWVDQVVEALMRAATMPSDGQPINIGSGQGTPILHLAERILTLSSSPSKLDLRPAREVEVARFVADIARMRTLLGLEPPSDPLFALPRLLPTIP